MKNTFAQQFFNALGLILAFIQLHISNICLFTANGLILYVLFALYSFEIMLLGLAIMLLLVSLTTSDTMKRQKQVKQKNYGF